MGVKSILLTVMLTPSTLYRLCSLGTRNLGSRLRILLPTKQVGKREDTGNRLFSLKTFLCFHNSLIQNKSHNKFYFTVNFSLYTYVISFQNYIQPNLNVSNLIRATIFNVPIRKNNLPMKIWYSINCKVHPNLRDVDHKNKYTRFLLCAAYRSPDGEYSLRWRGRWVGTHGLRMDKSSLSLAHMY